MTNSSDMSSTMPSLADKAEAMMDQLEAQHTQQVQELKTTDVVQQTPEPPEVETPTQTTPQLTDDYEVTIKVDGKEQTVKFGELKNGYSRESTFTQRMQTLGQQRRQLEEYFAQKQAEVNQQAQAIQLAYQQLQQFGRPQQKEPEVKINPNDIATHGELQQYLQQLAQQVEQTRLQDQQAYQQALAVQQQTIQQELAVRRDQERFSNALTTFMESEDGQLLSEINPQAEALIRYQTMLTNPDNTDEAIKNMSIVAKEWAQKVKGRVQTQTVKTEVAKAKTVMEPPTGVPAATIQQQKPSVFKKDGGVDYNALFQRSLALMD